MRSATASRRIPTTFATAPHTALGIAEAPPLTGMREAHRDSLGLLAARTGTDE